MDSPQSAKLRFNLSLMINHQTILETEIHKWLIEEEQPRLEKKSLALQKWNKFQAKE